MPLEKFQRVVDINLTGVFLAVRECSERMVNNGCRGLICLISSTGSLGTAGQIDYSSPKAAMAVMPKVITAQFFRRRLSDRIRCVAVAPGYVGTPMVKGMPEKVLGKIIGRVPIGRPVEPEEVPMLVGDIFRNKAIAGETFFIHGGLRPGSTGQKGKIADRSTPGQPPVAYRPLKKSPKGSHLLQNEDHFLDPY